MTDAGSRVLPDRAERDRLTIHRGTPPRHRLRAVYLAVVILLSVFSLTVSFSGSAAAANFENSDADVKLTSGDTYWQGQTLYLDATGAANDEIQIRYVTDDRAIGRRNETVTLDSADDSGTLDTSDLDGRYVAVNDTQVVAFDRDGTVDLPNSVPKSAATGTEIHAAGFEVVEEDLSVSVEEADLPVRRGSSVTLEIAAKRGTFAANLTADDLDEDDLEAVFDQPGDGNDVVAHSVADDDDSIQVLLTGESELEANFSQFDTAGSYTFEFNVNDSSGSASVTVDVQKPDIELGFTQSVYSQEVGDEVELSISMEGTRDAYVWIGAESVNYLERVHVVDDDADGDVALTVNTYRVGRHHNPPAHASGTGDGAAFRVSDGDDFGADPVVRFNRSDFATDVDIDARIPGPIEAGQYPIVVTPRDHAAAELEFTQGEITVPSEQDFAVIDLTDRSTDGIRTLVAPNGSIDLDVEDGELAALLEESTASDTVAVGDRLIVAVDVSGIYGYVNDSLTTSQFSALTDGHGGLHGIHLVISDESPNTEREAAQLDLPPAATALYPRPQENRLYLLVDTREAGLGSDTGDVLEAEFRVGEEEAGDSPNPYVTDGDEEVVSTTFTVSDPVATFDAVEDGTLAVERTDDANVSGTTNVAPGTVLTVQLRRSEPPAFRLRDDEVTVAPDGTWVTTFDTAGLEVNTTFTATVTARGQTITDEMDAHIVETGTTTPSSTRSSTETAAATESKSVTTTPTPTPMATPTAAFRSTPTTAAAATEGQSGFGPAIAVVVVVGVVLYAHHRRN